VWPLHQIDAEGKGSDGVRLADVNGDGLLDAVSGWEEAGEVRVYLHPGADKAATAWPKVVVGRVTRPEDAVFVDLDGDGAMDVVSCTENGGPGISVHWAPKASGDYMKPGAWRTASFDWSDAHGWMWCAPAQLDGAHGVDLVAGGKSSELVWLEAPGNPRDLSAWKMHVISEAAADGGWTMSVIPVDIDGDRDLDIVWTSRKKGVGAVRWMENPGPGEAQKRPWKAHRVGPDGWDWMLADVGDVDGNGYPDIVAPVSAPREKKGVYLLANPGPGEGQWKMFFLGKPAGRTKGAAFGDFNGDGRMDVGVTVSGAGFKWLEYDKTPLSEDWTVHAAGARGGGKMDVATLYDVDGDGDTDVMTCDERGAELLWYENPLGRGVAATGDTDGEADNAADEAATEVKWKLAHSDPMTGDWKKHWRQDAEATITTGEDGMTIAAEKGHDVIWFKPVIAGDIRIEYNYVGLGRNINTILLLVQATGIGGQRDEDIFAWADQRNPASYRLYRANMHYVSASYANRQDEIRIRQQPETGYLTQAEAGGLFAPGEEHHVVFQRVGADVRFTATNKKTGATKTFTGKADLEKLVPKGRIGIRHMGYRKGRYSNFKVYTRE
jgi:hypothetical protein